MSIVHPAKIMPFQDMYEGLQDAVKNNLVTEKAKDNLRLYTYTNQAVYEKAWNTFTLMARGLILDVAHQEIVALPFPKFFNYGEMPHTQDFDQPFVVYEKLDGSLIILFYYDGEWQTATKGSFFSAQAEWAENHIDSFDLGPLNTTHTYLAEAIYPENRIVVPYQETGLILLAAYDNKTGTELPEFDVNLTAEALGWNRPLWFSYSSIPDLVQDTKSLTRFEEGFVVLFQDGTRMKFKGDEYCRLHRMISKVTPLGVWDMMRNSDDIELTRKELPEEFREDFDNIYDILSLKQFCIINAVDALHERTKHLSDKEVGLMLSQFNEIEKKLIFPRRKGQDYKEALFKFIRPTGNILEGYIPSSAMNRVVQEN